MLDGKVAIVTGAAMGMGEATARVFAKAGARVLVSDINEELGEATAERIRADGGDASFFRTDVSSAADAEAMVRTAVERYGRLDCAVNNAAVTPDTHAIAELDEQEWDRVLGVDLKGVALCLKYEIRQLLAQGEGGSLVNIGSVSSHRPQPNNAAYVAAKHGVIGLSKVASLENAPLGIRVNTVCPGAIDTPMVRRRARDGRHDRGGVRPRHQPVGPVRHSGGGRAGEPVVVLGSVLVRHGSGARRRRRLHLALIRRSLDEDVRPP
nr:SDR family NAD(P)-dependent oxidoreductase [Solirubrobacter soli]